MYAQGGIRVRHILGVVDSINQVLYAYRVVLVPDKAHLVIVGVDCPSIERYVPTSCEVLCESGDITAVCVHQSEVAVSLQQCRRQLCIRVDSRRFCVISVNTLHVVVTT